MTRHLFHLAFWADAAERAIKTAAQVALVAIGQDAVGADLWGANLGNVAALAASAALVSPGVRRAQRHREATVSKAQPSVDIDAILAANVRKRVGGKCNVCTALAAMPDEWRDKFEAALADTERFSASSLIGAFDRIDVTLARGSIERHRRRECVGSRGHA
jgi:hypothetical protein